MSSFIKNILLEAGPEVSVKMPEPAAPVEEPSTSMPVADVAPSPAAQPQAGFAGIQGENIAPTVQKTVINKELVLAIFSEFKSLIANCEKRFEKEEMGIEEAKIYISNFLNSLSYTGEKLSEFIGVGKEEQEVPEMPMESPANEQQEMPPTTEGETAPEDMFSEPASNFTNPEEI